MEDSIRFQNSHGSFSDKNLTRGLQAIKCRKIVLFLLFSKVALIVFTFYMIVVGNGAIILDKVAIFKI